jgi:hypothetical protein
MESCWDGILRGTDSRSVLVLFLSSILLEQVASRPAQKDA